MVLFSKTTVAHNNKDFLWKNCYAKNIKPHKFVLFQTKNVRKNYTFKEMSEKWLLSCKPRIKGSTYYKYANILEKQINTTLGNMKIIDIDYLAVNTFLSEKLSKGSINNHSSLSPSYVRTMATIIESVLQYSIAKGRNIASKNVSSSEASNDFGAAVSQNISDIANFAGNFFKGISGVLSGDVNNVISTCRDDLFVLTYITNMFSHDCYANEGMYDLLNDYKKGGLSRSECNYGSVESKWKNEDNTFTENKTLTNKMINDKNNHAYGGEIEYILQGGTDKSNKKNIYTEIFAIRFTFNLIYGFTKIFNSKEVTAIASGISAATCGVVPAPVVQLLITLGCVAAESVEDVNCIKVGMPVILFKNDETWKFNPSVDNIAVGGGDNKNINNNLSFRYSDYLKLFLFVKLIADKDTVITRVGKIIEKNMAVINKVDSFKLSNCQVYYCLEATCHNPELMLALPVVKSELTSDEKSNLSVSKWNEYTIKMYRGY